MTHRPVPLGVLVLCTGNAARSVMAGAMLAQLAPPAGRELEVVTAGTHAVDGQPMSLRTRTALESLPELDLPAGVTSRHRSHQVSPDDLQRAQLVVAMEADHVRYVRRRHPGAAPRTATLLRLCRQLPPAPPALDTRVAALGLESVELTGDEDVADPAGQEQDAYNACARQLYDLCRQLVARL